METGSRGRVLAVAAVAIALALALPALASARLEVSVLARIPGGYPANVLVAADGTIYAGTFKSFPASGDNGPSRVFAYARDGRRLRTYTITGQTPGAPHGVQVAATDREGLLYLLDQDPARVLRLDPRTGAQTTWATFAKLTGAPEPDFAAWGPDGSLYVTDYTQALIWRVPPDGGAAKVWLADPRFNGIVVGPAGIQLMPDGHTLMVSSGAGGANTLTGKLYTLPIEPDGRPGPLHQVWESGMLEAPDGFAIARSGNVYIALVGPLANAVVEISPTGREIARVPANPIANQMLPVPFDAPGSVTFAGDHAIVGNQSSIAGDNAHMALLDIAVGEAGLPLALPPAPVYKLRVSPTRPRAGHQTRFRFTATVAAGGPASGVPDAKVRFAGRTAVTDGQGHATVRAALRRAKTSYHASLVFGGKRVASTTVRTR
jgi:sugar lactone lactonase YvrE